MLQPTLCADRSYLQGAQSMRMQLSQPHQHSKLTFEASPLLGLCSPLIMASAVHNIVLRPSGYTNKTKLDNELGAGLSSITSTMASPCHLS